jgi:hypothetical protein
VGVNKEGCILGDVFMAAQKNTRRQKDISRLLREKKYNPPQRSKKDNVSPAKKRAK